MNTLTSAQDITARAITIKDIEVHTRTQRKLPAARQFYIEFSVGDKSRSTDIAKEAKNRTSWDETFFFDGNDSSELLVKVYQKHRLGKNKIVGNLSDTVGGVLARLENGAFEDTLHMTSDELGLSGMAVKFAVVAETAGRDNAEERQAADAVAQATQAANPVSTAPAAVGVVGSVVATGTKVESVMTTVQALQTKFGALVQRLEVLNEILVGIGQIHPYISLALSVITAANKVLISQKNRDDRIIRLVGTMNDAFAFVDDVAFLKDTAKHAETITLLIQQVAECGYFIAEYVKDNFWIRMAKYSVADIDKRISDYEDKLREYKTALADGLAVRTGVTVVHMMNRVDHISETIDLNDMPYAFGARFEREKGCLQGTREAFLRDICDALNNPSENAPRICLLTGVAGSGKSAVAHSIARLYHSQQRLGSSYCFAKTDVANRNPRNLFTTIARDLSDHVPQYKSALWEVVKGDRALRTSQSPLEQLETFIVKPYKDLQTIGPLVVVIDALDEGGEPASRRPILDALSEQIAANTLPSNLRFLITTRPEPDILDNLPSQPHIVMKRIGDISDDIINGDIRTYIQHSLRLQGAELRTCFPDKDWCEILVYHSQTLFQWASTACNFIRGDGAEGLDLCQRFEILVQRDNREGVHPLDKIYRTILDQHFTRDSARRRFRDVMAVVLALHYPLSMSSLSTLFLGRLGVREVLKHLASVLDGVLEEGKPIRPLHTSFRDFLLDEARSSIFHVDIQPGHFLCLGQALLASMRTLLRFNICNLKDSRIFNTSIPDLPHQVNKAIPPHLAYSCLYWMDHLQHATFTPDLLNEVTLFFKDKFPYWLEAISLLSLSSPVSTVLSALETCTLLSKWAKGYEIASLASEAFRFIQVFASVLRGSTPHLYLSAMPQTPTSSPLCQLWAQHLQKHISITSYHPSHWPAEVYTLHGHRSGVICATYSPDGGHVVSGSEDNTIRVWNATTGQPVAGPFQGHTDWVNSVAYSPDGKHIVSGSWDNTIRIWNATTGQSVAGPFQGHTERVTGVAYSPDGNHVVSGSKDSTIRVWNATTGQLVAGPFWGHTDRITSVAFSPDGNHIVSGSDDNSVRVWNAATGQSVAGPLWGHNNGVTSVAYSPDGKHIVSSSVDTTIRLWNATTGQPVASPFQGHTEPVNSVAYSPNGNCIVSGSLDNTIRVWNATTGQPMAGPFQGHTKSVMSVAYSPDGNHIVSGSLDNTVRFWNATTEISQSVPGPFQGHINSVTSTAYAPSGSHIVSGSRDNTIWVWNATTGQPVAGPFHGHTEPVNSVAYSPDGNQIVSGASDNTIWVWDVTTGQSVIGPFQGHMATVSSVAYSPDGNHIVSGSFDNTIMVWDATTGQLVAGPLEGHTNWVTSVAYSPDGKHVVSGSGDHTIRIWDASTGQSVAGPLEGHANWVTSVAYSPDGKHLVSSSGDHTVRIWDTTTGQSMADPFHVQSWVTCVAYSPDGSHIAFGSWNQAISIWKVATSQFVAGPFPGHIDSINSIAYSPDGSYIVTGSEDHSVKVWSIQELISFHGLAMQLDDSWIQSSDNHCLGWIAPWNSNTFHLPKVATYSDGVYQTSIDTQFLGESWMSCWQ